MKTKEELNVLKKEFESLSAKLAELTEDELKLVTGGASGMVDSLCGVADPTHPGSGNVSNTIITHIWDIAPQKKEPYKK